MKPISIHLTQNPDGTFAIASFTNTAQLTIGLVVDRKRVEKWVAMLGVTVRVIGPTPVATAATQLDLLGGKATTAKSVILAK